MKKILSLVLAAAMLTTVAFAADPGETPGGNVDIGTGSGATDIAAPGDDLGAQYDSFKVLNKDGTVKSALADPGYRFSSEYFSVAAKKFTKGSNLVKEVKFSDDADELLIVLNGDQYDLARPGSGKSPNLVIDKLEIKAKKDYPSDGTIIDKGETYSFVGVKELFIGYETVPCDLGNDNVEFLNGKIVKFTDDDGDTPYETADIDELDVSLEGRVYKGDKVYVKIDGKANTDVLKMDDNADMRFYNIKTNGFPSTTSVSLLAEEDEFVYKIVDGKLTASGLKWSDDDYAWTGKIRGTTSYVVSDIELKSTSSAEAGTGTDNPDTGANDVVGIAAALALVSLVAAGAVSLKK